MSGRSGRSSRDWDHRRVGRRQSLSHTVIRDGRDVVLASADLKNNPANTLARAISNALDPDKAPGKVRTLADMSEEERAEMQRLYGRNGR